MDNVVSLQKELYAITIGNQKILVNLARPKEVHTKSKRRVLKVWRREPSQTNTQGIKRQNLSTNSYFSLPYNFFYDNKDMRDKK